MYAQTKGQQEQNALKETAMHTDNANQINSILSAYKLSQAQLEAGKRTADHESTTRYLNRVKQNADLIRKSAAIEQDKDAQRGAETEMRKIEKSLNLKYPNVNEEVVKANLEKDIKEAQLKAPNLNITEESIKPGTGGKKYIEYYQELLKNQQDAYTKEYSKAMDLNDLKDLELGESIDFDDGVILCLSKFENPNSGVKDILYSYSELLLVDD